MKDKLRELAEWMRGINGHCADALTEILDAEGDGGAQVLDAPAMVGKSTFGKGVHWSTVIMAAKKHYEWRDDPGPSPEQIAAFYIAFPHLAPSKESISGKALPDICHNTNHPARFGVVSDEDVSVVAKMIADRVGNGMREKYEDVARQIVELMAERQAAMQGQDGEVVGTEDARERVMEAIAGALGYAFDCTRVWSAWSYGTMSEDDFSLVREDDGRLGEIADAAIAAIQPPQPVWSVSDEDVEDARRYRLLRNKARQNTAHDVYGNGGHWSVGFFSSDNRLSFDAAIDAMHNSAREAGE